MVKEIQEIHTNATTGDKTITYKDGTQEIVKSESAKPDKKTK